MVGSGVGETLHQGRGKKHQRPQDAGDQLGVGGRRVFSRERGHARPGMGLCMYYSRSALQRSCERDTIILTYR